MIKPVVVASSCLEFKRIRYNGQSVPSDIVRDLEPYVNFIRVCPEYEIGLGVPRKPIRIVQKDDEYRLIQHETNKDVTEDMNSFTRKFIDELGGVDGFIFKSRSPTMGLKDIKIYAGMKGSPVVDRGGGFFAGKIAEEYRGYPVEESERLRNRKIREHFLTQLFLFARYRDASEKNKLEEFHGNNKLLFKFYDSKALDKLKPDKEDYFEMIKEIMLRPPESAEIYEFFKGLIGKREILEKYKNNRISFETLKEVSRILINDKNLLGQTFFQPFPRELKQKVDEDRNRDYWKKL